MIAGHRDTHFSDIDSFEKGQTVVLEDKQGRSRSYRVVELQLWRSVTPG